jgi:beta-galactosidase beta subunit
MLKVDALAALTKDTQHLPESSFYLGCADVLTKEASKEFSQIHRRNSRYRLLQEAEESLKYALILFEKDKIHYQENQKNGFLERKYCIDNELKKLQVKHIKMLIDELIVV